jgi:thymidine kinase
MFSSKTTSLLQLVDRWKYQNKISMAFKPIIDDRYSLDGVIVTHNDEHMKCFQVSNGDQILETVASSKVDIDCVAVDELFMIPGGAAACIELFKKGYDVAIASIDLSFTGEPFEEILKIMPFCTEIHKCTAVCSICKQDARYTYKKPSVKIVESFESDKSISQIEVGGDELYEPRCQRHHPSMCI